MNTSATIARIFTMRTPRLGRSEMIRARKSHLDEVRSVEGVGSRIKGRVWGHEYVITSLLEIAVS
jgi:hypothetical protein